MIQTLTAAYYVLPAKFAVIMAAVADPSGADSSGSGGSVVGGDTVNEFTDMVNSPAFKLPLVFFKVMAVAFFFWMIFKIVEAVSQAKWPQAVSLFIAAALIIFLAWNPVSILVLLKLIGDMFTNVIDLIQSNVG